MRVYLPQGFDDEVWKFRPEEWIPELIERRLITEEVLFHVADIVGCTAEIPLEGEYHVSVPDGVTLIVLSIDGEMADQGTSVEELVERTRRSLSDWDWPMEMSFIFWTHHPETLRMKLSFT